MKKPNFWTMRAALTPTRVLMGLVCSVALAVLPGISSCSTTCDDVDAQGNPITVDCIECSTPPVQCAGNVWYLPPGSECLEAQRPLSPDGTACDLSSSGDGVCNAGVCEGRPVILAGSGSTTWSAPTSPPGGGTAPTTGGCSVFVPALNNTLFFDVVIQLDVVSDGATNFTTAWTVNLANPLLGPLSNAAELGSLSINAVATNATGGPINSGLTAAATGQFAGIFYAGPNGPLELLTPGEITAGAATLTPTAAGVGSIVNVNWDGVFTLAFTLGGSPLFTLDGSNCDFSVPGTGVDFPVEDCAFDLDCEDPATECLVGSCLGSGLCAAEVPGNDGGSCASGFGSGEGTCSAGSCVCTSDLDCGDPQTACLVAPPGACDLGTGLCAAEVPGNDGASCASGSGSGDGTCAGGVCDSNDACTVDGDCLDPGTADDCQIALCDTGLTPYACGSQNAAVDTSCDAGGGPGSGVCDNAGVCKDFPCTEQGILDAIAAGGGPYTFACSGPTTVVTQAEIVIDNGVMLDGEGNLTVDGNASHRVFSVAAGVTAELHGFGVTGGNSVDAGGVLSLGALTLTNSTVSGNTAGNAGGGVFNGAGGTLTLTNSTVSGNTAPAGGGILSLGTLTLTNSTVSGNTAGNAGGGIFNFDTLTLTNSTVSGNIAPDGGGIENNANIFGVATLTLTNTLMDNDCTNDGGTITSGGGNLESPGNTCGFNQPTDQVNVLDPMLGPLQDNGGPTMTHALLPGSVAIDHIPEVNCQVTEDQRGQPRPEAGGTMCDVGAFEVEPCTSDLDCEVSATACLVAPTGACDLGTGFCAAEVPNDGASCASGSGSGDGTCSAGSCNSNDACTVDGNCPDPGTADDCQIALCDTGLTPYACGSQNAAEGTSCDAGGGPGSGTCDNAGVCAAAAAQFELEFYQAFDLELGMEVGDPTLPPPPFPGGAAAGWDFYFAYNSNSTPHGVLFQNQGEGVEIAHLVGAVFADVGACDAASAVYTTGLVGDAMDGGRVILVHTADDNYFKVHFLSESPTATTFEYAVVVPSDCPNECATLQSVDVTPLAAQLGFDISVSAVAGDTEGDPIEYAWTGTGGSFADPNEASTTYTCEEVGPQLVTITVSDDGFNSCANDSTVAVTCQPPD